MSETRLRPRNYSLLTVAAAAVGLSGFLGAAGPALGEESQQNQAAVKDHSGIQQLFDGKSLTDWEVAEDGDFDRHGEVKVADGQILIRKGNPASGIKWKGDLPKVNYEIELSAKRTDGNDFFCGLTFPVRDQPCTWIVGGWGGGVIGLSNINGSSAVENETTSYKEFKLDRWYKLRLRVTEAAIQAWIDDEKVIDVDSTDKEFSIWIQQAPMKPLGIATWDTAAALKDIRLKRVE